MKRLVVLATLLCLATSASAQFFSYYGAFPDGYPNSNASTVNIAPQHPTILNGYVKRPPWHVAGVDYYVGAPTSPSWGGISSGGALTTTGGPLGTGFNGLINQTNWNPTVDLTNRVVTIANTVAITIDNWDFSSDNGWLLHFSGTGDVTLTNCKFAGTNYPNGVSGQQTIFGFGNLLNFAGSTLGNLTIKNNTFDQSVTAPGLPLAAASFNLTTSQSSSFASGKTMVVQYNWFKNTAQSTIELPAPPNTPPTYNIQYNMIDNSNIGINTDSSGSSPGAIITGISATNPVTVTLSMAPFSGSQAITPGNPVVIAGVQGTIGAVVNNTIWTAWTITSPNTSNTFSLTGVNGTGLSYTTGTGNWAIASYPTSLANVMHMHWTGQGQQVSYNTGYQTAPGGSEGFQLYTYNGNPTTTTASSAAGTTTITVASTSGWTTGMNVQDNTTPNAINPSTITNITGSVVTLNWPLNGPVGNGDSVVAFYPTVNPRATNNTMISLPTGTTPANSMTIFVRSGHGGQFDANVSQNGAAQNNFIDLSGLAVGAAFAPGYGGGGALPGNSASALWQNWSGGGNIDMTNGKSIDFSNTEH